MHHGQMRTWKSASIMKSRPKSSKQCAWRLGLRRPCVALNAARAASHILGTSSPSKSTCRGSTVTHNGQQEFTLACTAHSAAHAHLHVSLAVRTCQCVHGVCGLKKCLANWLEQCLHRGTPMACGCLKHRIVHFYLHCRANVRLHALHPSMRLQCGVPPEGPPAQTGRPAAAPC